MNKNFLRKNRSTGPVRNRSTGDEFEIYRSGRVEKILTGSISGTGYVFNFGFKLLIF